MLPILFKTSSGASIPPGKKRKGVIIIMARTIGHVSSAGNSPNIEATTDNVHKIKRILRNFESASFFVFFLRAFMKPSTLPSMTCTTPTETAK